MIGVIVIAGATLAIGLSLPRLIAGPTLYDRTLAVTCVVFNSVLVCAASGVWTRQSAMLDVAIGLLFACLVMCVAVLKVFRARTFQVSLSHMSEGRE